MLSSNHFPSCGLPALLPRVTNQTAMLQQSKYGAPFLSLMHGIEAVTTPHSSGALAKEIVQYTLEFLEGSLHL